MESSASAKNPFESLLSGGQIGLYTLLEPIGLGGEAAVWSGWDNQRERVVAIKTVVHSYDDRDAKPQVSSNFEQQVHLLASLNHPHVLPLYGFGETDDYFYFVMHYCCGGSLANRLVKGPLPLEQVIRLCAQITSALAYIHRRGIVHRDIKPSNILLDSQDQTYLADFGIAKQYIEETTPLHTGRGTGPYASYEQYVLSTITPQSDIYSLGILIYELLVGKLPWDGTDSLASRQIRMSQELPDLREENPALPPSLTDVLRRMTAFHWINRPSSAGEAFNMLTQAAGMDLGDEARATFNTSPKVDEADLLVQDGKNLLRSFMSAWPLEKQIFPARLTHQVLIDSAIRKDEQFRLGLNDTQSQFMLWGALVHSYQEEYWWQQIDNLQTRLQVCFSILINEQDEAAIGRALTHLLDLTSEKMKVSDFPAESFDRLVELAINSQNWSLRQNALYVIDRLAPRSRSWHEAGLSVDCDQKLASLALGEGSQAKQAARIIGHTRSKTAVHGVIQAQEDVESGRIVETLSEIRETAGGLPNLVPAGMRLRIALLHLRRQLFESQESPPLVRVLVGLVAGLLITLVMTGGLFSIQDAQMRDILMESSPVSNVLTIVAVDDASLDAYGRWDSWSRSLHAELINRLQTAGAKVIAFDFLFASQTNQDTQLSQAMQEAGNVVFPVLGQGDAYKDRPGEVRFGGRLLPQTELLDAAAAVGHANVLHDTDGLVRRVPLIIEVDGERYPSLALAVLQVFLGIGKDLPQPADGFISFAGRQIPVDQSNEMLIDYSGPPAQPNESTYHTVSYEDVIDGNVPGDLFQNKIVLVGMTAAAEPDRYLTPVSRGRPMYGVEILANIIEAIWSGRFIYTPNQFLNIAILLFLGALTGFVCTRSWVGLLFAGVIASLYFLIVNWMVDSQGLMLGLFFPFLTIVLSFVMVTTYKLSIETNQRRKIMQLFEKRVTPETARATVKAVQKGIVNLEGQVQEVSVLVAELRGHTSYANISEPGAVMEMVNRYWEFFNLATLESEGTTAHREGEQALAFFNAPLPQPDHAWRAVKTAFLIRERVASYHQTLPENHPHQKINLGYGIYTGKAIVGNVDYAHRHEYTVIGDAVNMATQMASLASPGQVLVNGTAYEKTGQKIFAEPVVPDSSPERTSSLMFYEAQQTRG